MLHDTGMRCKDPREFMEDMYSVLQNRDAFTQELPHFIHDVLDGAYVNHEIYYLSFEKHRQQAMDMEEEQRRSFCLRGGDSQQEFSRNMLSNLALDARHSLLYIHNKLKAGGYYRPDGSFPYVLQNFSDRALSFRPLRSH